MRKIIEPQMIIGEEAIANIKFDPRSRDEIPKLLKDLQAIYCNKELRKQVFEALSELVPSHINPKNGRNGMELYKIFALGVVRNIANNHKTLRQMLRHSTMDYYYLCIADQQFTVTTDLISLSAFWSEKNRF